MTKSSKGEGDLPLEARMQRLEEILSRMESDEVTLGEALELFEEGVSHVKTAEQVLTAAELRVGELLADGQIEALGDQEE